MKKEELLELESPRNVQWLPNKSLLGDGPWGWGSFVVLTWDWTTTREWEAHTSKRNSSEGEKLTNGTNH